MERPCLRAGFPLLGRCLTVRTRNKRHAEHDEKDSSKSKNVPLSCPLKFVIPTLGWALTTRLTSAARRRAGRASGAWSCTERLVAVENVRLMTASHAAVDIGSVG